MGFDFTTKEGNNGHFYDGDFVRHYAVMKDKAISFGLMLLNDTFTVETIVQDALLKLWNFRDTITSIEHAERFVKQNVKWGCYSYFRQPASRFQRQMVRLDDFERSDNISHLADSNDLFFEDDVELSDKRLKSAREAISFLFAGRLKEVIELYFIEGQSSKQIASRYSLSVRTVNLLLDKGKAKPRAMLVTSAECFDKPRLQASVSLPKQEIQFTRIDGLTFDQSRIYHLRTVDKCAFEQIAATLALSLNSVQQEYVRAWKIVSRKQQDKRRGRRTANSFSDLPVTLIA
ncbi:DNA-directed RNA polymerase specialized sigma24 family protein [Mucilaginibacter yixingensis]|uniref:DNA-directed RNA polymerase specialized sigma24 family protein n=1 Tax=Mucilaginibacter yixingensis TaxID=1295612 RepID=A0A2T5J4P2_9SPHI|nr:hypothetical protein [Mucilaginibacter yixingensis]PTQ92437.1 DNA-directed RNA polymerase specialized sigma24 family protein [Mucilaginibacter yixingensis]